MLNSTDCSATERTLPLSTRLRIADDTKDAFFNRTSIVLSKKGWGWEIKGR